MHKTSNQFNVKTILKKLNNQQIELAKTYIFIQSDLTRVPANIMEIRETKYIDESIF